MKWLLEKGAKPNLPTLHYGLTPLHNAAKSDRPEALDIMKHLLAAGADPNHVSNDREAPDSLAKTILLNATPLETAIASHSMSLEKTKLLLEHKADPNRKDSRVSAMLATVLDDPNASELVQLELVQLLGEAGFRMTDRGLMWNAVNAEKPKLIELLLKYGADPNTKDGDGNTFLAAACIAGDADRVRLLLKNGADPKQPGLLGTLIRRGPEAVPMIRILLEAGADPNAVDDSRQPPIVDLFDWGFENKNSGNVYLHSDKRSDQAKLLELLLKHGLDPNTTYSEFVRSATSSPGRSGGNAGSPFLEDTTETKTFPKSLLMMVVEMGKRRKVINVDMIGMLLDAGAKPSDEFPEVFDFVAKGDESLPITKALLPFRPQTLKLERTGYFQNWNPQVKRLFLDEILNPAIAAQGGVHFVFADRGGSRRIVEPNQAIPPMAELLLAELQTIVNSYTDYSDKREDPVITRVRRDAGGQWTRESIDWRSDTALPDLIAGDIIELAEGKLVSKADDKGHSLGSQLALASAQARCLPGDRRDRRQAPRDQAARRPAVLRSDEERSTLAERRASRDVVPARLRGFRRRQLETGLDSNRPPPGQRRRADGSCRHGSAGVQTAIRRSPDPAGVGVGDGRKARSSQPDKACRSGFSFHTKLSFRRRPCDV